MRVLVVDDDAEIALLISRILTYLGHETETCTEAAEAIEKHAYGLWGFYDVIVSDYRMAMHTGIEVLAAFEGMNCYRILLTANAVSADISAAVRDGVIHRVLSKPASIREITSALDAARELVG